MSDSARRVVVNSQEEARLLGHEYIDVEHLLLGMCRDDVAGIKKFLHDSGVEYEWVVREIEKIHPIKKGYLNNAILRFTRDAWDILERAPQKLDSLYGDRTEPSGLLVALLTPETGNIAEILKGLRVDRENLRQQLQEKISRTLL